MMNNKMRGIQNLMKALAILLLLGVAIWNIGLTPMDVRAQPPPIMTTFKVEPATSSGGIGDYITVAVNAYDTEDLWGWQVFMTWDPTVIYFSSLTFGDILSGQPDGTAQYSFTDYVSEGWFMCTETTFGSYPGNTTAFGWVISVTFEVLSIGETTINIDSQYTYWQDSALEVYGDEPDEMIKENGYFSNLIPGDIDKDGDVDPDDFYIFSGAYGTSVGDPSYDARCDLDNDGDVDPDDFYIFSGNYGKSV